jgi:hypothetical protein
MCLKGFGKLHVFDRFCAWYRHSGVVHSGKIARFRPVFYVFGAKREAQSAGHMLLTKRAARAQRGSRVHHPQGCIICAWLAIDRCIYIYIYIWEIFFCTNR